MKIVPAINLGLREKDPLRPVESSKPQKSEGMITTRSLDDKLMLRSETASKAIKSGQMTDYYKIKGTVVDKLA